MRVGSVKHRTKANTTIPAVSGADYAFFFRRLAVWESRLVVRQREQASHPSRASAKNTTPRVRQHCRSVRKTRFRMEAQVWASGAEPSGDLKEPRASNTHTSSK